MGSKLITVGSAALNQTPLDWKKNFENIANSIHAAKRSGIKILCLPELCITGHGCEDQFHAAHVHDNAIKALFEISKHTDGIIVSVGLPIMYGGRLYNASCLMVDGHIGGFVCKQFLANNSIHFEQRWFDRWDSGRLEEISIKGERYPIGDLFFKVYDVKIGFEICNDAFAPNRPGIKQAAGGVDIILNPSASHFSFGRHAEVRRLVSESSRVFGCAYIYSNLLGNESGRNIFSGDTIISSYGKEIAVGPILSYKDFIITTATVDLSSNATNRLRSLNNYNNDYKPHSIKCKENIFADEKSLLVDSKIHEPLSKNDEFSKSVSLGLFDYMRKTKSNGFVIPMRGDADSAAITSLIWFMCKSIFDELGLAQIELKLDYMNLDLDAPHYKSLINKLLTCVYQGAGNGSTAALEASEKLASFVNAKFYDVNINGIVNDYKSLVSHAISRQLSLQSDSTSIQNIQARASGPLAWMLADINNSILLSTNNRSSVVVGRITMDGDTCGGLSPIAGVDKCFIQSWLNSMEKYILALELINSQSDNGGLMPHSVLNKIEIMAIKDKKSPIEIFKILYAEGADTAQQCGEWIDKFFKLLAQNQWKRERYDSSFHLDDTIDQNRFPIISGQFRSEIYEMWQYINKER